MRNPYAKTPARSSLYTPAKVAEAKLAFIREVGKDTDGAFRCSPRLDKADKGPRRST